MGAAAILIILVVIVVLGGLALLLSGNAGWLSLRRSDPSRNKLEDPTGEKTAASGGRPRHTAVDMAQDEQDASRGVPTDRPDRSTGTAERDPS